MSFKISRGGFSERRRSVGFAFRVGSGVVVVSRGSESLIRGISRVPDLREREGDKEAILERSSSSGFIETISEEEGRVKKVSINNQEMKMIQVCGV